MSIPRIKTGDRARLRCGAEGTITKIFTYHHLTMDGGGVVACQLDDFSLLPPPESEYHVKYEDDELRLYETESGKHVDTVDLASPIGVVIVIRQWASDHVGIDVDEVRKMISVPTFLVSIKPTARITCIAIRYADGWQARMGHGYFLPTSPETFGEWIPEKLARCCFSVNGPYLEEKQ